MDRADLTRRTRGSRFAVTHGAGYDQSDVDAMLDEVSTGLGGTPGARVGSGTVASQPSALIEPPKGLFARIFGR